MPTHKLSQSILLSGLLMISGLPSTALAEDVIGQVTAVDANKGHIEINRIPFELKDNNDLRGRIKEIKPGQVVRFESSGKKLIRIQPTNEKVDFPQMVGTPGTSLPHGRH